MISETDIQIGDWLHIEYMTHFDGLVSFNFKVSQLRRDYGNELLVWGEKTPDGKHFGHMGGVSKIQPLSLTAEILEKNFPTAGELAWWPVEDGLHCESRNTEDIMVSGVFRFVHQLQHALRLCGIEKEIVI